jgi:hypothetical protein
MGIIWPFTRVPSALLPSVASVWETTGVGAMGLVSPKGEEGNAAWPAESNVGGWGCCLFVYFVWLGRSHLNIGRMDGEIGINVKSPP